METNNDATLARQLFLQEYQAVLSTLSVDVPGYPFGSVVPYCVNRQGDAVILISDIAQHTKNIIADPRVSLITLERHADDQQAAGRVTIIGDASRLDKNDIDSMDRYYSFFPHSRDYHKTHGFYFYTIKPVKIRFIGGFGQINWLLPEGFSCANPFTAEQEQQIVEHMNHDHADAIRHYCQLSRIPVTDGGQPEMVGIDGEGFHIKINKAIHRIDLQRPISNSIEAREALVAMARQRL